MADTLEALLAFIAGLDDLERRFGSLRELTLAVGAENERLRSEVAAINCELRAARRCCRALLMFHSGEPWTPERQSEWNLLTGGADATTKGLCDFVRETLHLVP